MSGVQGASSIQFATQNPLTALATTASNIPAVSDPFANPNGPFANLNLTPTQQQQIQQILGQSANGTPLPPGQLLSQLTNVLSPQQQQTLQNDLQTLKSHHGHGHHHHGGGDTQSSQNPQDPLAALDLTPAQQTQVGQILQSAQTNGTAPGDVLTQIDGVLTSTQQQQLTAEFAAYTNAGTTPPAQTSFVVNANA